jgi:DNA-binding FrmR family transcriptional regulator
MVRASDSEVTRQKMPHTASSHAKHESEQPRLRRIAGQIQGIEKMIGDGRYCVDILMQLRAVHAAIRAVELNVLKSHLSHCVNHAFQLKDARQVDQKIDEIVDLLKKTL